jgi:hypothetical protein
LVIATVTGEYHMQTEILQAIAHDIHRIADAKSSAKQVFAPYDDQTDWKLASRAAIDGVRVANGEAVAGLGQTAA